MFDPHGIVSRRRQYSFASGWTAEIVYCLPLSEVDAHVREHWQDTYPEVPGDVTTEDGPRLPLTVLEVMNEPWMDGDVVQADADSPDGTGGHSSHRRLTYKFGMAYTDMNWPSQYPRPSYADGTTLKMQVKCSAQFLTLPGRCFTRKDDGTGTADPRTPVNQDGRILIPLQDFLVEWDRITDLGSMDFRPYVGKVNKTTFLGAEPETLMLETADIDHSFIVDPAQGPWAWRVRCNFKQRRIAWPHIDLYNVPGVITVSEGDEQMDIFGWNHDFRENPFVGWQYVLMQGLPGTPATPRYQPIDFTDIFF